jgi:hypothetical protein
MTDTYHAPPIDIAKPAYLRMCGALVKIERVTRKGNIIGTAMGYRFKWDCYGYCDGDPFGAVDLVHHHPHRPSIA